MSVYDLAGRKALVTGGARGLGEGMARALARAGAAVVIADIREDLGKSPADELRASGARAEFVPLDVTAEASWAQAVPQAIATIEDLSPGRLWVCFGTGFTARTAASFSPVKGHAMGVTAGVCFTRSVSR